MKVKTIIPTESADQFKNEHGIYVFPFDVIDKTPGGSNLGRIEWHMEFHKGKKTKGRYYIEKILVWATQTRDERYVKKIFEIPCYTESIYASPSSTGNRNYYLSYVWRIMQCEVHNTLMFSAYPENQHVALEIGVGSSISADIMFK